MESKDDRKVDTVLCPCVKGEYCSIHSKTKPLEAKDTYLSNDDQAYLQQGITPPSRSEQAETSFSAGEKQGIEKGRREVVEWIEGKFKKVTGSLVKPYRFINEDDWQALRKKVLGE